MNTDWLHSFAEAVKWRSLSKASKELNLSQPALSKQIRNLEDELGTTLFYRSSSGIELTEAGEYFYARMMPVVAEITHIRQHVREMNQRRALAVGSLPSIATYYLPFKADNLQACKSPYTLMIQNTSIELVQSLQEGRLQAAFLDTSLYPEASVWSCQLFTEPYYAVFPVAHRYHQKTAIELADLCNEPLIVHQGPCDSRQLVLSRIEKLGVKPSIIREVAFGDFIYGYVMAGMGITIVPELVARNLSHLELFVLPIVNMNRTISLAAKNEKLGRELSKRLLDAAIR